MLELCVYFTDGVLRDKKGETCKLCADHTSWLLSSAYSPPEAVPVCPQLRGDWFASLLLFFCKKYFVIYQSTLLYENYSDTFVSLKYHRRQIHFIFISVKGDIFLFCVLLSLPYSNYVATGHLIL